MAGSKWPHGNLPAAEQLRIHEQNKLVRDACVSARRRFDAFFEYAGLDEYGAPVVWRPVDELAWPFIDEAFAAGANVCLMLPNGFGKTLGVVLYVAWRIGQDHNLICSLVTDSEDESEKRVKSVREVLKSRQCGEVFPDLRLPPGKPRASAFRVVRTGHSPFDTLTGYGVLTGTGARARLLVLDDVVTFRNAVLEPANRERVHKTLRTTWFSRGQRAREEHQQILWIQTAYHAQDATARIREDSKSGFWFLIVRAEPPFHALSYEKWMGGRIVKEGEIPSHLSAAYLQEEWDKQGPSAAAQSMANRPVDPETCPFKEEMLLGPPPLEPSAYERRTVFADPAGDASTTKSRDTDWCAMAAIGKHPERGWETYGFRQLRGKPSEQAAAIAEFAILMEAEQVFQEAVKDEALVGVTQQELEERGSALTVQPDKPTSNKEARIVQALEPALVRNRLSVCGARWPELRDQMIAFPGGRHDDGVDALASCWLKAAGAEAAAASDQVVPRALLETCSAAEPEGGEGVHIGVAIAGYRDEESVAVVLRDRVVVDVEHWPGMDEAEAARRIDELRSKHGTCGDELVPVPEESLHVAGHAVVDQLYEKDLDVDGVDLQAEPFGDWEDDLDGLQPFRDRRAELYWVARLLLQAGKLGVPARYVALWNDLSAPTYKWDRQGRVVVESPEEFRKRKERAPVFGEALVVALSRAGEASPLS